MSARSSFSLKTCLLKKIRRNIKRNNPKMHSRKSDVRKNEKHANTKSKKNATENAKNDLFFLLVVCFLFACFLIFSLFLHVFFFRKKKKHNPFLFFLFFVVFGCFCCFWIVFFCICFFVCFSFLRFPIACVLHLLGDPVLHLFFSNSSFFAVCLLFFSSAVF